MIVRVWERCVRSRRADLVVVATDDERIADAIRACGGNAQMTSPACPSGTDRVAEACGRLEPKAQVVINVQGDEPFIDPRCIDQLAEVFEDSEVEMATLARPLPEADLAKPQAVKVVCALSGDALYFSRAPIPFARSGEGRALGHVGIYGYRAETLVRMAGRAPTPLEKTEQLEQLRALEWGVPIRVLLTDYQGFGVDTPEDLQRARAVFLSKGEA
jgi:3-deoxy-manno-octulosonate cytidylyltransferase (CMP-KDO synthetase)